MDKLLHIIAAPRGEDSRTLKVSKAFLAGFHKKYPSCRIEDLDLFAEELQPLTIKMVYGKYILLGGKDVPEKLKDAWSVIERYINQFLSADAYLISAPMWNFSVPYALKHYIDIILQPKYLFRYGPNGAEGLVKNKKMIVATSRGGDYRPGTPAAGWDYEEPYLRTVFGFCGIKDITFINAQPMDMDPRTGAEELEKARVEAKRVAEAF